MKNILILALAAGLVGGLTLAAFAVQAPATISLEITGKGSVAFDHALHEGVVNGCKSCHHFGVGNGSCDGCHGVAPQAAAVADALAKSCAKCHAEATTEPAPEPAPEPTWKERTKGRWGR